MKFKSIFILFNLTLVFVTGIVSLLPFFMLGSSFTESFWRINWPLILLLIVLFAGFNVFYFINRKLFLLLEKEDWPALVRYLEDRVIQKGNYSPRLVRLLANCYLVLSDSAAVMSLENKVAIAKPALVDENALVFGTARILGKDISGAVRFFDVRKKTVKAGLGEWVHWYHGFALLLDRQYEDAAAAFSVLAKEAKDGIVTGLSSYFLYQNISQALPTKKHEFGEIAALGADRVRKALPGFAKWNRERSRLSTEIYAAALSKYMEDSCQWLYAAGRNS